MRVIVGERGTGKTNAIIRAASKAIIDDPNSKVVLISPYVNRSEIIKKSIIRSLFYEGCSVDEKRIVSISFRTQIPKGISGNIHVYIDDILECVRSEFNVADLDMITVDINNNFNIEKLI